MTEVIEAEVIEENALVKIVQESGVEKETGTTLTQKFIAFYEQINSWKQKAMAIVVTDETQTADMKIARTARLALREIRVNADKTRKILKEDSLRYGRVVQSIYNLIEAEITPLETHLQEQEDFIVIRQAKKAAELKASREMDLQPYAEFVPFGLNVGIMPEDDFRKLLNGAKLQLQAKIEAAAKAEAERIAAEKAEAEAREKQRIENERLKAEAAEREKELAAERAKAEAERKAREAEARRLQAEADAKLAAERAERARLQAELDAKRIAEEKAAAEELRAKEKAAAAPDKAKLNDLAGRIDNIEIPALTSKDGQKIIAQTRELLAKVSAYIRNNSANL